MSRGELRGWSRKVRKCVVSKCQLFRRKYCKIFNFKQVEKKDFLTLLVKAKVSITTFMLRVFLQTSLHLYLACNLTNKNKIIIT